jgi:hypothetical protein
MHGRLLAKETDVHRDAPRVVAERDQAPAREVVRDQGPRKPCDAAAVERHGAQDRCEMRGEHDVGVDRFQRRPAHRAHQAPDAGFDAVREHRHAIVEREPRGAVLARRGYGNELVGADDRGSIVHAVEMQRHPVVRVAEQELDASLRQEAPRIAAARRSRAGPDPSACATRARAATTAGT